MRGLQEPPKTVPPSRKFTKFFVFVFLLLVAAAGAGLVFASESMDSLEVNSIESLELETRVVVDGIAINVVTDPGGPLPVVILHDLDMTGAMTLESLSMSLGSRHHGVRVDLPGFGYSDRIEQPAPDLTVSAMAARVASFLEQRYSRPVTVMGFGFGGEVGAELAFSHSQLVRNLVMVDTAFLADPGLPASAATYPLIGKPALFLWETGGTFAADSWSPFCSQGGWCPTGEQLEERSMLVSISGTTDSLHAYWNTPPSALAATNLDEIQVPMAYVWSSMGTVAEEAVSRLQRDATDLVFVVSDTYQAAYEDPQTILEALLSIEP